MLRARTDGQVEAPAESRIARERGVRSLVTWDPAVLGFDAYPRLASPGHAQPTPVRMAASARNNRNNVSFTTEFPMTVTGKIPKYVLRRQIADEMGLREVATA